MKYFTPSWFSGEISDEEIVRIRNSYWKYIDEIYEKLPFTLKLLAKSINLHDGLIQHFSYSEEEKKIIKIILGGDLQVGYFCLNIIYLQVQSYANNQGVPRGRIQPEIQSDEIEFLDKELFSHRLLFLDTSETEIQFKDLTINIHTITEATYMKEFRFQRKNPIRVKANFLF